MHDFKKTNKNLFSDDPEDQCSLLPSREATPAPILGNHGDHFTFSETQQNGQG